MSSAVARGAAAHGTTARTTAQAKVNLFLRALAREVDGYHQIETLFCRLDLGDDVVVRTAGRGRSLDCTGDVIPPGGLGPVERNLAWRAAVAYADATGWPNDWEIAIDKRIPVGGGLGGGSADAGAVLRCLNALAPSPLSDEALLALASPLGADVPFLTSTAPLALAWGRGERLLALAALPTREVTLVCFPFGVPTRDAYAWLDGDAGRSTPGAAVLTVEALSSWEGIARIAHNDFETVVASRYPAVEAALIALRSASPVSGSSDIVLLAGSGATVFRVSDRVMAPPLLPAETSRAVRTRTAERVVAVEVSD